ncbi:MAG: hypothetical protein J7539_11855 [Niabella sp.]|nr:hypothetical protein [Niabella sp.]
MQRIEALIEKLRTQFKNKAALSQMLLTTQMIQREINGEMKETAVLGSSNVAVFIPNAPSVNKGYVVRDSNGAEKEYFQLEAIDEADADQEELRLLELQHQAGLYQNPEASDVKAKNGTTADKKLKTKFLEDLKEIPTLFLQQANGRLNGAAHKELPVVAADEQPVKSPQIINNLTTDISPSDKERFVKNLFRGDEIMYNRSLKTINNFRTLGEAEFWVTRELKTKLGWINNSDVEYFDRLVYRKFN